MLKKYENKTSKLTYILGADKFPVGDNKYGILSSKLDSLFNGISLKHIDKGIMKSNANLIVRKGIKQNKKNSFIEALASLYKITIEELVKEFYLQMQPHFAEINKGNVKSIKDVEFVKDLGLGKILALDDADTNEAVCEYLKNMIQAAVMWSVYKNIPKNLLKSIGSAASSIESGKQDNIDINLINESK